MTRFSACWWADSSVEVLLQIVLHEHGQSIEVVERNVEKALNFILSGDPLPAIDFKESALIDAYFEDSFIEQAIAYAKQRP